jgi:hypothetical protein
MAWLFDVATRAATLFLLSVVLAAAPAQASEGRAFGLQLELRYLKQDVITSVATANSVVRSTSLLLRTTSVDRRADSLT